MEYDVRFVPAGQSEAKQEPWHHWRPSAAACVNWGGVSRLLRCWDAEAR